MAEIVNLRRVRKRLSREKDAARAEENRLMFGRTRAERQKTEAERGRQARELDGARLEPDADPDHPDHPDKAGGVARDDRDVSMKNDGQGGNGP